MHRLLPLLALLLAATSHAQEARNVVLILADDLGYMDVGANNPKCFYDTPNLDRLAHRSTRFTNGYAANPVCSPTRYSLMTGKYPTRAGATNYFSGRRVERFQGALLHNRMDLSEETIAEALKTKGYATFFAGKWHLGPTEKFWPENQGFDVNKGGWKRGGPYGGKKYFSPYGNPRLEDGPDGEHLPDRLATETAKFIEEHKDERFFTYLAFYSVHTPLMAPKDLVQKYAKRALDVEGEEFGEEEQNFLRDKPRRVRQVQKHAVYAGMVEAMDRAVGKVIDKLDELGLMDDTMVIFTSDNGGLSTSEGMPTSNLPLRGGKGWVYEGGIREPFFCYVPGTTAGTCAHPVMSIDVFPTVLDWCGVEQREVDGVSMLPLARDEGADDRLLFWHYPHYGNQGGFPSGAVRDGKWKLIERYEDGRVHLYDLEADIGEKNDVAAEHPKRVKEMRAALHGWYREVGAKFLRPRKEEGAAVPWAPGE